MGTFPEGESFVAEYGEKTVQQVFLVDYLPERYRAVVPELFLYCARRILNIDQAKAN